MAQIVTIAAGTYQPGINELGDIVATHEDGIAVGSGYDGFNVIEVAHLTLAELRAKLAAKMPSTVTDSKGRPTEWRDPADGQWKQVVADPKYYATAADLTADDVKDLADPVTTAKDRDAILDKLDETIHRDPANTATLVS